MKSILTVIAVAGFVAAAEPSKSTTSTPPSMIPSSASPMCSTFLDTLNSAPGMQSCLKPALDALSSKTASSLPTICSTISSQGCSDTLVRSWLTYFKGNCSAEITSKDKEILTLYNTLYIALPFSRAVCAKDASGNFCLSQLTTNGSSKAVSSLKNAAQTPLVAPDGSLDPEAFSNANVLWMGSNPQMNAKELCTPCMKSILTSFITFESQTPPATALSDSPFLDSQPALWAAVQKTCPPDWISGTLANAHAAPGQASGVASSSPVKGAALVFSLLAAGLATL